MTQETPTLRPPEAPAPAEMETPTAPAAPAETPQEPAAPAEGAEEVTEPTVEAPPWADDHPDISSWEDVKAFHETERQKARDEGYQTLQSHMQPTLQTNQQQLSSIGEATDGILTNLNKLAREGAVDANAVSDLMRENKGAFAALNGVYQAAGFWEGVRQYVQGIAQASGDMGLSLPFIERLNRMQYSTQPDPITGERKPIGDPTFLPDFVKKVTEKARGEGDKAGYKRGLIEGKAAKAAAQQVQQAKVTGPNLAPGSPAGSGKYTAEQWTAMTTPQRNKAREEGRHPLA